MAEVEQFVNVVALQVTNPLTHCYTQRATQASTDYRARSEGTSKVKHRLASQVSVLSEQTRSRWRNQIGLCNNVTIDGAGQDTRYLLVATTTCKYSPVQFKLSKNFRVKFLRRWR